MGNLFTNLLQGPLTNPFRTHHRKRTHEERLGTKHNYHLTWERKTLPGAGAGQYAWETYGLPQYSKFGFGNINVQKPMRETFPASYTFQNVGVIGNPPLSIVQGQFVTQPLMDPNAAALAGIVTPGAIVAAPNSISTNSPVLAP